MVLDGFQILDLLGMGGMGAVYKVQKQGAIYALKVILNPAENDLQRFEREAISLAAAKHPNIVQVHTMKAHGTWPYILFEFVEGEDLSAKIIPGRPWSLEESLRVLKPLASALDEMHRKGIIHRDLKPANILIRGRDSKPLLTDFGIAKNQDLDTLTQQGEIVGTISYMAPEQISGDAVCAQTDLWALAIIFYQLLSGGEFPFTGASLIELAQKIMIKEPRPIGDSVSNDSESLTNLFTRALTKDPKQRYPSAKAFIDDCEVVLHGEVLERKATRLFPALFTLGIIVVLLLCSMGIIYKQGEDWEAAREREAQLLGERFQELNSEWPLHYLDHCLSLNEEKKCCVDYEALSGFAKSFEQELEESANETFSWKDPRSFQRSLVKIRPSLESLGLIHSKDLKRSSLDKKLQYKHSKLLEAALNFSKGQYFEAHEIYANLDPIPEGWRSTVKLMQASCAFRLGNFEEAARYLQGVPNISGRERLIDELRRSVQLNLSVEELFRFSGGLEKSRAMMTSLVQSETKPLEFFAEWNRLFQARYDRFNPKKAYWKEAAYLKHRELSYDFPRIDRLLLSEDSLKVCLKSALQRRNKGAALIYCARLKALNPRFSIPKTLRYDFDEKGQLNFVGLCVEAHHRVALGARERLEELQFILEAARQGFHLEGLDGMSYRDYLAADPAIVDFLNQNPKDPFLRFWKAYIRREDSTKRSPANFEDFNYAFNHNKTLIAYKAIALTEQARRLLERHGVRPRSIPGAALKRCQALIEKVRPLPHPRPNVIELLRFSVLLYSCKDEDAVRRVKDQLGLFLTRAEAILKLRKKLTMERDLMRGRPPGLPMSFISGDMFRSGMAGCSLSWGALYFGLGQYDKAIPKFLELLEVKFYPDVLNKLVLCIEKTPRFNDYKPILRVIEGFERRSDFRSGDRLKLQAFKSKILKFMRSR